MCRRIAEWPRSSGPGHGVRAGRLPGHHRDPFDRILTAQAQTEGMTVLTRDKWIPTDDVQIMSV